MQTEPNTKRATAVVGNRFARGSRSPCTSRGIGVSSRAAAALLFALAPLLAGCGDKRSKPQGQAVNNAWAEGVTLQVTVIDDPPLAAALRRRSGEWTGRTGGMLKIAEAASKESGAGDPLAGADVVVFSPGRLSQFAEQQRIVPLRMPLLEEEALESGDFFPPIWDRACRWGGQRLAVPLGMPAWVLYYRPDLLEHLQRDVPETWQEYGEVARLLAGRDRFPSEAGITETWYPALEPLAPGWAGGLLLLRSAAYALHSDNYSTVFDVASGAPLIDGPPFERALTELQAAVAVANVPLLTPDEVRQAVYAGKCGMAITWCDNNTPAVQGAPPVNVAPLPGSAEVYSIKRAGGAGWEPRDEQQRRVTLVGTTGRLASVTSASKNAPAAMRLLAWICSREMGTRLATASSFTGPFRQSHLGELDRWLEPNLAAQSDRNLPDVWRQTWLRNQIMQAPRTPAADSLLAELDSATRRVIAGETEPSAALAKVAEKWRTTIEAQGTGRHLRHVRQSLGIAVPDGAD